MPLVIALVLLAGAASSLVGTTSAGAVPRQALVNAATVSGSPSQEEQIATGLGFAVTVVDDATWAAMSAADFGQYDLLIAGDPTCGVLPAGLVSSASVFGPVVLGTAGGRTQAGNRAIVGTDPALHDGGDYTSARGTIIREGIAYAGSQPGRTGMYFDTTCAANYYGQSAETLTVINAISAGSGTWTIDADPPCGGSVSLIASNPSFVDLTTASLEGWACSVHESFPTFTSDWSALAVATDTTTAPTCGIDPGTGLNACGEAYILISGSAIVVESQVISVGPLDATNPIGTSHTVTANVHAVGGSPVVVGQLVDFTVTGQNAGATGTCVPADCKSDVNGNVTFTYVDGAGAGDDTIKASFTDNLGSLQTATAQKHWVASTAAPTTLNVTATTGDFADATTVSAVLTNSDTSAAVSGKTVTFTLNGTEPCSGTTDATGTASCAITPGEPAATYSLAASFAGDSGFQSSNGSANFVVTLEETALSYTGATSAVNGQPMTLSGVLTTDDPSAGTALAGKSVVFTLGTGGTAQTCSATTDATGTASCNVASVNQTVGSVAVSANFAGDTFYVPASASSSVSVFAPTAVGAFVIGNVSAGSPTNGTAVNFWGAEWAKHNSFSARKAPASMKGFANSPLSMTCGSTWTTRTGNSSVPPTTIPSTINVIVSSNITQSGSTISGNIVHIVVVQVNPGYGPNPGHAGNGRIIATVC
jgi:hypothetical protein